MTNQEEIDGERVVSEKEVSWRFDLGRRLEDFRNNKDLSRKDVESKTGISESTLRRVENGDSGIKLFDALQLARLYDKTLFEITGESPKKEAPELAIAVKCLERLPVELRKHHIRILQLISTQAELIT